ncbi:MAG TPA: polyprenol phosphomannose-dependent alpha 1,6 mannosyltransferase MptB [Acidimicrobiales bacterium]|nr:polyprenol phosphomannose-dependent alpha 1,6 mannosyltransferase MptB [Acidimicrobiales bacterium]
MSIALGRPSWLGTPVDRVGGTAGPVPEAPGPDDPGTASAGSPDLRPMALLGTAAMCAVVIGAVLGGTAFVSSLPGAWYFGTPGGPLGSVSNSGKQAPVVAVFLVYGGLVLAVRAWLGLLRLLRAHRGVPVRRVVGVIALWVLPLLVAPPLFSRDVFSYAGQGEMVSHHIDPYSYGTGVLGATPFSLLPGTLWANTPSPYGPVFLAADGAATSIAQHEVLPDLILLRLLELGGLALVVGALPTLARSAGRDPAEGVALGAASPLVLTAFVGGAHNDALMVGLLVAGLAVAKRVGPVPGIVLCALAAGVKAPAILGVLFLGWNWARGASFWWRVFHTALAGVIATGTLAAASTVSGLGWGWLTTLSAPDKVFTGVTPVDALSHLIVGAGIVAHVSLSLSSVATVAGVVGLAGAALVGSWLLVRSPVMGSVRALGLALLVLALLGPILWAWYLTWGLVVLAPVAAGRLRRVVIALTIVETFLGVSAFKGMVESLGASGVLPDLLLLVGILAVVLVPLGRAGRLEAPRLRWLWRGRAEVALTQS